LREAGATGNTIRKRRCVEPPGFYRMGLV